VLNPLAISVVLEKVLLDALLTRGGRTVNFYGFARVSVYFGA